MSTFRIQEFAKLAGVTVRALHHYDRLGLLSPSHRTESGYRQYCHDDLGLLERILVLRYLGLSLREIGELLNSAQGKTPVPLSATLARQRAVLRERREGLDRVLRAIEHAQACVATSSAEPDWLLYQTILKEIQMQQEQNWTEKYYTPEGIEALRERRAAWTPEQQADLRAKWQELLAAIQSAIDRKVDLASDEVKALVARWMQLADAFTLGNRELESGVTKLYADRHNWPQGEVSEEMRKRMPTEEHLAFFHAAVRVQLRTFPS